MTSKVLNGRTLHDRLRRWTAQIHRSCGIRTLRCAFQGVLKQFGGRLLAADEQPEIIEGRWDRDKIVLLSFSNATAFRGFFESAQYREIAKDRKAGADTVLLLVHGIDGGGS